jgi:hypothetical protein
MFRLGEYSLIVSELVVRMIWTCKTLQFAHAFIAYHLLTQSSLSSMIQSVLQAFLQLGFLYRFLQISVYLFVVLALVVIVMMYRNLAKKS